MRRSALSVLLFLAGYCVSGCREKEKTTDEVFQMADSSVVKGEFEKAVKILDGLAERDSIDTAVVVKSWSRIADICGGMTQDYGKAIEYQQRIISRYPDSPFAAECMVKIAMTYETLLLDKDRARLMYEAFLKKFPNHELARDVKITLEHWGESDEEFFDRTSKKGTETNANSKKVLNQPMH